MIGISRPLAQRAGTPRCRRRRGARGRGSPRRAGGSTPCRAPPPAVSAGIASKPASRSTISQRPQDLRLVVADEDAAALTRGTAAAARARASAARRRSSSPWPGSDSTRDAAAVGLDEAARRSPGRGPSRGRCRRAGRAVERLEDALLLGAAGCPGPRSTTRTRMRLAARARADRHRVAGAVAQRVLEQVRERALELRGVGVGSAAGRASIVSSSALGPGAGRPRRGAQHLLDRRPVAPAARRRPPRGARGRAACRPAARAARPRSAIARGELARGPRRRASATPSASPAARIAVSGERRSCETARSTRGLDLVAAPQRARLDDLAREPLALERGGQQRLERGHDALARAPRASRAHVARARRACRSRRRRRAARTRRARVALAHARRARSPRTAARARRRSAAPPSRARLAASGAPSSSRASSAARSASRRRCSASQRAAARELGDASTSPPPRSSRTRRARPSSRPRRS